MTTAMNQIQPLPARLQEVFLTKGKTFQLQPGQLLFDIEAPASAFYLIQEGHVSIELPHHRDQRLVIQTVGPGEVVGWSWTMPPYQWQFAARAVDAATGLQLDADWLRRHCEQDKELTNIVLRYLLHVVAERLSATRLRLLDFYK